MEQARRTGPLLALLLLTSATILVFLVHVRIGTTLDSSLSEIWRTLMRGPNADERLTFVVWELRMPRALACLLIGALLGGAGSGFQALLKNRLAEPYTLGTASGAAIGGVIAIIIGFESGWNELAVPFAAMATGILSIFVVMALAFRRRAMETVTLLLCGVLVGALLNAALSLALVMSGRSEKLLIWLLGSVDPMYWSRVGLMAIVLVVGGGAMMSQARVLNALAIGEETAARLGVRVSLLRTIVVLSAGAMASAAVGCAGIVGFVGLVAPFMARKLIGVDWRWSLPGSMVSGALLVVTSDAIGQRLGSSMPLGVMTALIGSPFLLALLGKSSANR